LAKKRNTAFDSAQRKSKAEENPTESPEHSSSDHRIFQDPAIEQTVAEDPLFKFLQKWWKNMLVIGLAVFAIVYGKQVFQDTYEASMRRAAGVYGNMRQEYLQYVDLQQQVAALQATTDEESKSTEKTNSEDTGAEESESAKKLKELTQQLQDSSTRLGGYLNALRSEREPYSIFASLYSGLLAIHRKDIATARKELAQFDWRSITAEDGSERFYAELASSSLSRALLDQETTVSEGIAILAQLAQDGMYFHVSSALTLASIASTEEEKEQARLVLQDISEKHPEQAELVSDELKRLTG